MLCVQDPGLHDAISSPHLYDMLKVTLAPPSSLNCLSQSELG